eukprot:TRINITY_DN10974_c0_g1_i1.p1 TRINITY_DN10974_c0_g1~~TRINITY_DN10974_c0_g1_i1.p1  ORF type:complete len:514 (+),score=45.81 TRINITY_DN10974_c0_g1_i1:32-1543(+)
MLSFTLLTVVGPHAGFSCVGPVFSSPSSCLSNQTVSVFGDLLASSLFQIGRVSSGKSPLHLEDGETDAAMVRTRGADLPTGEALTSKLTSVKIQGQNNNTQRIETVVRIQRVGYDWNGDMLSIMYEESLTNRTIDSSARPDIPGDSPWPLFLCFFAGSILFHFGGRMMPHILLAFGKVPSGMALCIVYVASSVTVDIFIKTLNVHQVTAGVDSAFAFNQITMVLVVEIVKLVMSVVLFATSTSSACKVQSNLEMADVGWMVVASLVATVYHSLVFTAIGSNDSSVVGLFRNTTILWTATMWRIIFRKPFGGRRIAWMCILCVGLCLSQLSARLNGHFRLGLLWVLAMTLCNSLSVVMQELAFKRNDSLDINLQAMIFYGMSVLHGAVVLAIIEPEAFFSVGHFFRGFTTSVWFLVGIQSCIGLLVARILKYMDSVMKAASVSLSGPTQVVVAPIFVKSTMTPLTVVSAIVLAFGSLGYLSQGTLDPQSKKSCQLEGEANLSPQ